MRGMLSGRIQECRGKYSKKDITIVHQDAGDTEGINRTIKNFSTRANLIQLNLKILTMALKMCSEN